MRGGVVFTSIAQARTYYRDHGVPLLSVFRGVDLEPVAALAIEIGGVTLVADELDLGTGGGKKWSAPSLQTIVHHGRHHRVDLMGGFRSTRNVPEDLLSQADVVFIGRHTSAGVYDLQTVKQRFGEDIAATVQTLEPMRFIVWRDE